MCSAGNPRWGNVKTRPGGLLSPYNGALGKVFHPLDLSHRSYQVTSGAFIFICRKTPGVARSTRECELSLRVTPALRPSVTPRGQAAGLLKGYCRRSFCFRHPSSDRGVPSLIFPGPLLLRFSPPCCPGCIKVWIPVGGRSRFLAPPHSASAPPPSSKWLQ